METLHEGFSGRPKRRFFPGPDQADASSESPACPNVLVYVLGPSRDESVIRDMDPPAGQSYLQLYDGNEGGSSVPDPFREDWWMDGDPLGVGPLLNPHDRDAISHLGSDLDFNLAMTLDKAVNGTSLMLMLQVGDQWLLFPGDAQWGTWKAAMDNPQWNKLLEKTTFYKIGHHGSHNATPVEFVEKTVGQDFCAMASTHAVKQWPSIPKEELLSALGSKTKKIARSDRESDAPAGVFHVVSAHYIETEIPLL